MPIKTLSDLVENKDFVPLIGGSSAQLNMIQVFNDPIIDVFPLVVTLAIKAYMGNMKINLAINLTPVGIEPGTSCNPI